MTVLVALMSWAGVHGDLVAQDDSAASRPPTSERQTDETSETETPKTSPDVAKEPSNEEVAAEDSSEGSERSPGQADLDAAMIAKLTARSAADLEKVVELCESAIRKGLDEENLAQAENLMASTLLDNATRLSRLIFDQQPPDPRWRRIRRLCLQMAQRAVEVRPDSGDGHLLIARLHTLPGGDQEVAKESANQAIELLSEEPARLSEAYRIRGASQSDSEKALDDLNRAVKLNPRNADAWRSRGLHHLVNQDYDKALDDLQQLLNRNPDDLVAHQAVAQTLSQLEKYDEALTHIEAVLEENADSAVAYQLKAKIKEEQGDIPAAIESLNQAISAEPRSINALLYRARLRTSQEQFDLARSDVERVLHLRPDFPQAILLRSLISAAQDRMAEAIGDIQQLLKQAPDNLDLKRQLATLYEYDQRPRRAIEIYNEILEAQADDWVTLRRRGDAWLSIGEQQKAIEDYQAALKIEPDDSGILNNLAWVLATSPDAPLRDGEQAIEYARKACELTDYQAAHILSTLAAAYAETGDFKTAIKWSTKAVELDSTEEPQLKNELESYKSGKPWREKQEVEENPLTLPGDLPSDDELADDDLILPDLDESNTGDVNPQTDETDEPDAASNRPDADSSDTSPSKSEAKDDSNGDEQRSTDSASQLNRS